MTDTIDKVELITDSGGRFTLFTDITWSKNFLDPCQTMTATIAADRSRFDLLRQVQEGTFFTLLVNDAPQMAGIIDSREITASRQGTEIVVTGRDFLSRVVDPNADPRLAIAAEMPFDEFCQKVFEHFGFADVTIFEDGERARNVAVKHAIKTPGNKGKRRRKLTDPAKALRPKDNEGGWQWFTRIAHPLGYHAWHMPDGSGIVVGTPDYEQVVAYRFVNKLSDGFEGAGAGNNILLSRARLDITGLPSDVFVRGKGTQPGEAKAYTGHARNDRTLIFKPFFVCDDQCTTQAECDAKARLVLSKAEQNAQSYEITVRGLSDPKTGRIYNVDTVAEIDDERCDLKGKMWVLSRTSRKARAGTTTSLKLIPCNALLFDYLVSDTILPAPKTYAEAVEAMPSLADLESMGRQLAGAVGSVQMGGWYRESS